MNKTSESLTTRREFIKTTGRIVAASALAGVSVPYVFAAGGNDLIQLALVGCGGRGTGAARNALNTTAGPIKIVALADLFENQIGDHHDALKQEYGDKVDVPAERRFVGFDAYMKAMDCLKPGDVVILATPPAFRWVHFAYAISKGLNVFMEKPVAVDGPTCRRMFKLGEESVARNLKVGVGLMSRHSRELQELHQRIQDGEIGDLMILRGYRLLSKPLGTAFSTKWPGEPSELLWQIKRFHSFLWTGGGCFNDFYIHHIDHLCWMKNAWPIKAEARGGRHFKQTPKGVPYVDQNFDTYSVEYTFADGAKLYMNGSQIYGGLRRFSSFAHGTKGMAIVAASGDSEGPSSTYKGQNPDPANRIWISKSYPQQKKYDLMPPYQNEWDDLLDAIRNGKPYNEVKSGVEATLVASMGRMAAHTAQEITYEDMLNCEHEFGPDVDKFTMDSKPPLLAGADGKYPGPVPGANNKREY